VGPRRTVGVDWSGAADPRAAARTIWLAVVEDGRIVGLETGRGRAATIARLIELVFEEPETVIGLDFCFSAPAWFLDQMGMRSAGELWRWAEAGCARDSAFVLSRDAPFWGPGIRVRPPRAGDPLRRTEHEVARPGAQPGSIFQLSGPGSVGAQSLHGMPGLLALCDAGVSIWPFDPPRLPCAVEVFPRVMARVLSPDAAHVSGRGLRRDVCARYADALGDVRGVLEEDQDAFDAAVTALALERGRDLVRQLEEGREHADPREGAIVVPELA